MICRQYGLPYPFIASIMELLSEWIFNDYPHGPIALRFFSANQ